MVNKAGYGSLAEHR